MQVGVIQRTALLVLCCLLLSASSSPVYPALKFGRHADAIFTNSYRKVLGQISARKFLQTVMGKRLGPETESNVKRQSSMYGNTYKQDVDMNVIESEQSYRDPQKFKFALIMH
ncbi:somatoliberin precursor [Danio rerio]|uniref:Somatoliberin n=1 Tax=Danio rerio TaxID=7955 RepID=A0A181_DANRE|nr:somatoliberin precursor [Danio rerio]ABH10612.1 growth hormone-releasing hormone precursor [Danio rerio]ABJ55980.1 growth hormone-releasing hormone precursor [Danio rerio]|eukprot:NP_001073561.1 somatoliberin precursor [Danio rerio]